MEAQADAVTKDAEAAVMPEGPNFRMGLMEIDRQVKSIKVFIGANRITPWLHIENFPQPMPPLEVGETVSIVYKAQEGTEEGGAE